MSIADKLLQITENQQKVYDAGYDKGKAEGGGNDGELVAGYDSSYFTCMLGFTNTPNKQGDTAHTMANNEGWDIASFYGSRVQPGEKYKIIFTRVDGYDYWQTFLFGVGNYLDLIEPATNENVLKHINIIDDNTYEITIPEGCYWFSVNFYNPMPCYIYKLN